VVTTLSAARPRVGPPPSAQPTHRDDRPAARAALPMWPLMLMFGLTPVWWLLGAFYLSWPVFAVILLVVMLTRGRIVVPKAALIWLAFLALVVVSATQIDRLPGFVPYGMRLAFAVSAVIVLVYVYNAVREQTPWRVVFRPLMFYWLSLIVLGWSAVVAPRFGMTSLVEYVLPGGLSEHLYVRDLVHVQTTEYNPFGRNPIYRTAAPYPYTNNWGTAFALLLPCVLAYVMSVRDGLMRKVLLVSIPFGIVPAFLTLNRGMFLGVGVAVGVMAIRALINGNVRLVGSVAGVVLAGYLLTLLIPVQDQITERVGRTDSTSDRLSVYGATLRAVLEKPIFGHGVPTSVDTTGASVALGEPGRTVPLGTQGQIWMVSYSHGILALLCFVGFLLFVAWRLARGVTPAAQWLSTVPLVALAVSPFYGLTDPNLSVMFFAIALGLAAVDGPVNREPYVPSRSRPRAGGPRRRVRPFTLARSRTYRSTMSTPTAGTGGPVPATPGAMRFVTSPARTGMPHAGAPAASAAGRTFRPDPEPAPSPPAGDTPTTGADEVRRSARSGMIGLAGAAVNGLLGFVLTVVIVRGFGPVDSGAIFAAIGVVTIVAAVSCLGADTGLIWGLPRRPAGPGGTAGRLLPVALVPPLLVGSLVALGGWFAADAFAPRLLDQTGGDGTVLVRLAFVAVPVVVVLTLLTAAIRALRPIGAYVAVQYLLVPLGRPALVVAALATGGGVVLGFGGWLLPVAAGVLVAALLLVTPIGLGRGAALRPHRADWRAFWGFALPRAVSAAIDASSMWVGVLLAAALAGQAAAGVFGAVGRYALAGLLVMQGLRVAVGPQLSRLLGQGRIDDAARVYGRTTVWIVLLSWPVYVLLAVFAPAFLELFGDGFAGGARPMAILAVAMMVNSGVGLVQTLLLMSGRSGLHLMATVVGLTLNIVLAFVLIPAHGATGAAIAWGTGVVAENTIAAVAARRVIGRRLFSRSVVLAGLASAGGVGLLAAAGVYAAGRGIAGLALTAGLVVAGLAALLVSGRVRRALRAGMATLKGE
jgi:O-antigen/teichoic acid export membrane protein